MPIRFNISVKPGMIGKQRDMAGLWDEREMTPTELAQWSFFDHTAYCHSVFDAEKFQSDPDKYKTNKANAFFKFSEVVTVDIDSKDLSDVEKQLSSLNHFLALPFVKAHCFLISPSSGNSPEKPNWHLSFKLDTRITNTDDYRRAALILATHIDLKTDQATARAAQPTAGTKFKDAAREAAGYNATDLYVNDDALPVDVAALLAEVPAGSLVTDRLGWQLRNLEPREFDKDGKLIENPRVKKHREQSAEDQEKIVLECLSFILSEFSEATTYEEWFQVWTAAHDGCAKQSVMEYIIKHPSVFWSDAEEGRNRFNAEWNVHQGKESGGYTVASLFYLARRAGWLTYTGYEIDSRLATEIDVAFLPDWLAGLEQVPPRLLVQSQTGSGKTQSLIALYKRLGAPKSVVFVPTVKLATELVTTLRKAGLDATLYMDEGGKRHNGPTLAKAQLLVTTLQSFATKVHRGDQVMKNYGLVYVEESDQLLSSFARGGGGKYSSHVRDSEARTGFEVMADALLHSPVVWMVDATMSQVTYRVATALSAIPVQYILNTHQSEKAPVHFVSTIQQAYVRVLVALTQNKHVVVAADTKERAAEVVEVMKTVGALDGKRSLLITRDTEHHPAVSEFMADVDGQAPFYDLVAYNSVMASGVSITSLKPDVVVQFGGYLSPRANLQMLNRYRKQTVVYCNYRLGENFYKQTAEDIYADAGHRLYAESRVVHVPVADRTDLATLRGQVASIAIGDEEMQNRAAKEFYMGLLVDDGRRVFDTEPAPPDKLVKFVKSTTDGVKQKRKEQKEFIKDHWQDQPIVDVDHPPAVDMDDLAVACGQLHGEINDMLLGHMPSDVPPRHVADVCELFRSTEFYLTSFARQEQAITRAEQYLSDGGKAITSVSNLVTLDNVLFSLRTLLPTLDEQVWPKTLVDRAPAFLAALDGVREYYDRIFERGEYKYDTMRRQYSPKGEDDGYLTYRFARVMLEKIGLDLKVSGRRRIPGKGETFERGYAVSNLDEAEEFLNWKYRHEPEAGRISLRQAWTSNTLRIEQEANAAAAEQVEALNPSQQAALLKLLQGELGTSRYRDLVEAAKDGGPT